MFMRKPDAEALVVRLITPDALKEKPWLRKQHIAEMLRKPDAAQHLQPTAATAHDEGANAVSLYSQVVARKKHALVSHFAVVVVCERKGDQQLVHDVWRLYPSEVQVDGLASPLELLKAFLDSYGLYGVVGGAEPSLLTLSVKVPVTAAGRGANVTVVSAPGRPVADDVSFKVGKFFQLGSSWIDASIVYAVNLSKYERSIARYGA
jgi:hypothetical protein